MSISPRFVQAGSKALGIRHNPFQNFDLQPFETSEVRMLLLKTADYFGMQVLHEHPKTLA